MKMRRKVRIANVEVGQQFRLHVGGATLYTKAIETPSLDGTFMYNATIEANDGALRNRKIGGWVYVEGEETWMVDIVTSIDHECYEFTFEQITNLFPELSALVTPKLERLELVLKDKTVRVTTI